MPEIWKLMEGQVVDGKFPLLQYLGGSEHGGVFLTEHRQGERVQSAAIKLVPAQGKNADVQLSRWRLAATLPHPHLIPLYETGICQVSDLPLVYVVMEYAEENLAQVLADRALTLAEARAMLEPVLDALAFLHGKGYVHGAVCPVNILANGEQLKLSSDEICRKGDPIANPNQLDAYDPPEYRRGVIPGVESMAPSGDIWSLGLTLIETLTQTRPDAHTGSPRDFAPSQPIPEPFKEIAHYCLVRHPLGRWTVADVAARLKGPLPAPQARTPVSAPPPAELPRPVPAAPSPQLAQPAPFTRPLAQPPAPLSAQPLPLPGRDEPVHLRWRAFAATAVAGLVLAAVAIWGGIKLLRPDTAPAPLSADTSNAQAAITTQEPNQPSGPITQELKPPQNPAKASLPSTPKLREVPPPAAPKSISAKSAASEPAGPISDAKVTLPASARGDVVQKVLPDVPQSAKDTIRGTVRVSVRVDVDQAGNVENADLASPGPSKYFSRLALDAARRWKFPAKVDGAGTLSTWTLQFDFTRDGTTAAPTQETP